MAQPTAPPSPSFTLQIRHHERICTGSYILAAASAGTTTGRQSPCFKEEKTVSSPTIAWIEMMIQPLALAQR